MKIWLKRLAVAGAILVVVAFLVLEALRLAGMRAGVDSVALPVGSEIASRAGGNDYADAYRVPIPAPPLSLKDVALPSSGGQEIFRGPNEVIHEGRAPGLRYLLSYLLSPGPTATQLTVSTAVFYESPLGSKRRCCLTGVK